MMAPQAKAAGVDRGASRPAHAFIASRGGPRLAHQLAVPITRAAERHRVPPVLVAKIINRESSFRLRAENGGCFGLMQVAGLHFKRGQNPYDMTTNLDVGCMVLAECRRAFPNSWRRALTGYNFGINQTLRRNLQTSEYAELVLAGK